MSDTEHLLTTALLRKGRLALGDAWGVNTSTVGKRLKGELGLKLSDFCDALDALGIQIIDPDDGKVLVDSDELVALRTLARKALEKEG